MAWVSQNALLYSGLWTQGSFLGFKAVGFLRPVSALISWLRSGQNVFKWRRKLIFKYEATTKPQKVVPQNVKPFLFW